MKPKPSLRSFLALSASVLLVASQSHAITYYWDNNGTTDGLSDDPGTSGTWNGATNVSNTYVNLVNFNNATLNSVTGTQGVVAGGTATTTSDIIYFGTNNLSLGTVSSTINTTGTININSILIGTGQTNPFTLNAGGTITLGGTTPTPTITVNTTSATATIAATVAGTVGVIKAGPGTLILTDASNSFTGGVTIAGGGTLQVGDGTSGSLTAQNLTFNNGGGVFNARSADAGSQGMGALSFSADYGTVTSTAASASATQTLTFASLAARVLGATGNFSLATNTTAADNKIVLTSTTNAPLDSGSNNAGLYFGGSEYARYDSLNGYFRAVIHGTDTNAPAPLSGSDLGAVTSATDVKLNGAVTAQTTAAVNTIHLDGNTLTLQDNDQVLDVNGILSNGGSIAAAGALQGLTAGGEIVFNVTGGNLAVATKIQDSRLTKTGAGTLTLSGANTYNGITSINAGTFAVSGGSAIADTGAVILANATGATLRLDASETIGSLSGGGLYGGNVDVGANTLTLAGNSTFGGKLIGSGEVTVSAGTLSLSNKNSFAGTITLNGTSQLALRYGSDSTTTTPNISSGGTINMAGGTFLLMDPLAQLTAGVVRVPGGSSAVGVFVSNPIVVTSGTATLRQGTALGARHVLSGGVTGGTSGSQTLDIRLGHSGGNAERTTITFSGVMQDGSGGTLGVSADFLSSSTVGQGAFICLSGQNTFTGPIEVKNTRGLTYTPGVGNPYHGAWFVIGGELTSGFSDRTVTTGSGSLGGGNYTNTISLATGTILNYASSANQTLGGVISGTGNIVKEGSGTLSLTVANSYSGRTTISAGTLSINSILSVSGGDSAVGAPTTAASGTIAMGFGTATGQLTYTGTGNETDRVINLAGTTGGAVLDQSGISGLLKFTSDFTATGNGLKTLTLQGSTDGTGEIAGAIVNSNSATSLTKTGTGTWTLSGPNTYTGATTVNSGTLLVTNTTGSGTGAGNVSVTAGTLGGTGSITGNVTIGNGTGSADSILAPGNNSIDSIATGNLTFNSDGSYAVDLNGTSATSDRTNVTGTVAINAATTLAVSVTGTLSAGQQYVIVSNDGADAVTGTFAGLAQDAVVGTFVGTELKISYTGGDGNDIVLYTEGSGSAYDFWAAAKGLDGTPGKENGKADDPDQDGKNNLAEFALDGDPLSGANDGKVVGKVATVGSDQVLTLTLPVRAIASFSPDSGDQLSALIDGIYYRIEGDVNLSTFADTITEVTGGDATAIQTGLPALSSADWTYRTFRAPGTVPTVPKAFLRAVISETP